MLKIVQRQRSYRGFFFKAMIRVKNLDSDACFEVWPGAVGENQGRLSECASENAEKAKAFLALKNSYSRRGWSGVGWGDAYGRIELGNTVLPHQVIESRERALHDLLPFCQLDIEPAAQLGEHSGLLLRG